MNSTILSRSYDPRSRSRVLARKAERLWGVSGHSVTFIDVRELALPIFDNASAFQHPAFDDLRHAIATADGVIPAASI